MIKYVLLLFFLSSYCFSSEIFKVAVIDSGLDLNDPRFKNILCKSGHKDFTHTSINDTIGHGTHVMGLIKKYAGNKNYCIVVYKYFGDNVDTGEALYQALQFALKENVKLINISGGGNKYSQREYEFIKKHKEITFVVAAGNDNSNLDSSYKYYPASYKLNNIITVGSIDDFYNKAPFSNYGASIIWEKGVNILSTFPGVYNSGKFYPKVKVMSGTSMSTAIKTGKIINEIADNN